jgi:hypothetical protein
VRDGSQGMLFRLRARKLLQRSPLFPQVLAYLEDILEELTEDSMFIDGIQVIVRRGRGELLEGVCLDADRIT